MLIDSNENDYLIVQKAVAIFFSNLISEKYCAINKKYSSDEILKNSICSYIELYPEYFSYIIKLVKNKNFDSVWNSWKNTYIDILINHNIIKPSGSNYEYINVLSNIDFERIKIDYISRFWIYGAVSHNSNLDFYDYYKNKNRDYILKNIDLKLKVELFLGIVYKI